MMLTIMTVFMFLFLSFLFASTSAASSFVLKIKNNYSITNKGSTLMQQEQQTFISFSLTKRLTVSDDETKSRIFHTICNQQMTSLFAFPQIPWLHNKENKNSKKKKNYDNPTQRTTVNEFGEIFGQDSTLKRKQSQLISKSNDPYDLSNEVESTMYRAVKMMDEHRRSQEANERTSVIMEELAAMTVVGQSKTGSSSSGGIGILGFGDDDSKTRGGGVKITFNGLQRPLSVNVDPKFLSSLVVMSGSSAISLPPASTMSTSSASTNTNAISVSEELNNAILDAMQDGYEKSGKIMEEKLKGFYEQLGLPKRERE